MEKETKGILSLLFSIYGLILSPPLSLFMPSFPPKNWGYVFLIIGISFGIGKRKTKLQKVGFIIGIIGIILVLIGLIYYSFM